MVQLIDLTCDETGLEDTTLDTENDEDDSSNDPDDSGNEPEDIKSKLYEFLSTHQAGGEIACFEVLPDPINPGLFVQDLGTIGLPLSGCDAHRVIKPSNYYAKNKPTINGAFCEISAKNFQPRNPAWQKFMAKIVEKTALSMGVKDGSGNIDVTLVKMVIQSASSGSSVPLSMQVSNIKYQNLR